MHVHFVTKLVTFTYADFNSLIAGCEYGDRIQGCRPWHCTLFDANRDIKSECCSTCNHGMSNYKKVPSHTQTDF